MHVNKLLYLREYSVIECIMKELSKIIAENVKYYRSETGLSQLKLAVKLDMAPSYLTEIETGKQLPSLHIIEKLSSEFNIEPYQLLYPRELAAENANSENFKQAILHIKDQIDSILDDYLI